MNKFLQGGSSDVTDGSINILGASLSAANLDASQTLKTNGSKIIISTDLAIADTTGLQTSLDSKLGVPLAVDLDCGGNDIWNVPNIRLSSTSATYRFIELIYTGTSDDQLDLKLLEGRLVDGPASSTDAALARFDGITGKLIKNSATILDDNDCLSGLSSIFINHSSSEDDEHALEIICNALGFGDVKALLIAYATGGITAGVDEECLLLNVDQSESSGGHVVGVKVVGTSTGAAELDALECGVGCNLIRHQSGLFINADSILNIAVDVTTALESGGPGNISVFVADNDTMTIGHNVKFTEIELILNTPSSGAGIAPTFRFSTGSGTWDSFTPADGTSGLRNNGVIIWELSDILTWEVGASGDYLIEIKRTRNMLTTTPILDLLQIAVTAVYSWDKDGIVSVGGNILIITQDPQLNTLYGFQAGNAITTGFDNTLLGSSAGEALTTGDENVFVGREAGHLANSNRNTGVGCKALDSLTTGQENTALGYRAFNTATSATGSTAVGYFAAGNTTQSRVTAIGYKTLRYTAGDDCTAVGYEACMDSDGDNNTGIGSYALQGVDGASTGSDNVAIGFESSHLFETGAQNVSVGNFSLRDNADGSDNTTVGYFSGSDLTLGDNNTFLGSGSGLLLTTGSDNTCVGQGAGSALTLADSDNICIGNNGVAGDSGEIRIGTNATHVKNFQQGIWQITPGGASETVIVDANGQLGSTAVADGDVSYTGGATISGRLACFDDTTGKIITQKSTEIEIAPNNRIQGVDTLQFPSTFGVGSAVLRAHGSATENTTFSFPDGGGVLGQVLTSLGGVFNDTYWKTPPLPLDYVGGQQLSWYTPLVINISPGDCRDTTDKDNLKNTGNIRPNINSSGVNGLDTGVAAADTWYSVWVIGDAFEVNPVAGLYSLSSTTPTLPGGYNRKRRVGWARTDFLSNFYEFSTHSSGRDRMFYWNLDATTLEIFNNESTTFIDIDASDWAPPTCREVYLCVFPSGRCEFRENGFTSDPAPQQAHGDTSAKEWYASTFYMPTDASQLFEYRQHALTSGSTVINLVGYIDSL